MFMGSVVRMFYASSFVTRNRFNHCQRINNGHKYARVCNLDVGGGGGYVEARTVAEEGTVSVVKGQKSC